MKAVLIGFISIIVLVLGFVLARGFFAGAKYLIATQAARTQTASVSLGGSGPSSEGLYTIHGVVVLAYSFGTQSVPYIQYLNDRQATSTKQLVYLNSRACAPSAGDYPCAPTYSVTDGYPKLTNGEPITVTGYIYENRFLITSLSRG